MGGLRFWNSPFPKFERCAPAYLFYFTRILPRLGQLISARGSAYTYLPDSVLEFPQRGEFIDRMGRAGFDNAAWKDLSGGIVCLYTGTRR